MRASTVLGRALLVSLALLPRAAVAYSVSPNLLVLRPAGDQSSAFLHLENKGAKPTAVEMTIQEHRKDIEGKTLEGPDAADDFVIFPAQLVMLPGDEVGVQVRWVGEAKPSREKVYTLVTREVMIPRKPTEEVEPDQGIRIAVAVKLNYEVRVYVTPPAARPKVVVESVSERTQQLPEGASGAAEPALLEIVLANEGNAHRAMADATLVLTSIDASGAPTSGRAVTLSGAKIPALRPHLLAGDRRRIVIPRPPGLAPGRVRVALYD